MAWPLGRPAGIALVVVTACGDLEVGLGPPPGRGAREPPSIDAGLDSVEPTDASVDAAADGSGAVRDHGGEEGVSDASEVDAASADGGAGIDAGDAAIEADARIDDAAAPADASAARDTGTAADAGPLGFGMVYKGIVRDGCGCHTSEPFLGGLDMSSEDVAFESLLGMPPGSAAATSGECVDTMRVRVVPGNPGASLLWQKLQAIDDRLRCGARMPLGGPPLPPEDVELVLEWIAEGALR